MQEQVVKTFRLPFFAIRLTEYRDSRACDPYDQRQSDGFGISEDGGRRDEYPRADNIADDVGSGSKVAHFMAVVHR